MEPSDPGRSTAHRPLCWPCPLAPSWAVSPSPSPQPPPGSPGWREQGSPRLRGLWAGHLDGPRGRVPELYHAFSVVLQLVHALLLAQQLVLLEVLGSRGAGGEGAALLVPPRPPLPRSPRTPAAGPRGPPGGRSSPAAGCGAAAGPGRSAGACSPAGACTGCPGSARATRPPSALQGRRGSRGHHQAAPRSTGPGQGAGSRARPAASPPAWPFLLLTSRSRYWLRMEFASCLNRGGETAGR